MKLSVIFVYLFLSCINLLPFISVLGQETGIRFESGLSWKEVQAKAKAENKPIFMDCFATWCGPCKYMSNSIFIQKDVGDYFNANFINIAVQMDKTLKDSQAIQDWYVNAAEFSKEYKIEVYPTYLFFSANGQALHQFSGSFQTGVAFMAKASDVFDPNKQYFSLLKNWKKHRNDSAFLLHALIAAIDAKNERNAREIVKYYIMRLKNPVTKYNIGLFYPLIVSEADPGFRLYLEYASRIDQLMAYKDFVEYKLGGIIFKEEIAPLILKKEKPFNWRKISKKLIDRYPTLNKDVFASSLEGWFQNSISSEIGAVISKKEMENKNWEMISKKLKDEYPGYDYGQVLLGQKTQYYLDKKLWPESARTALSLIDQYGTKLGDDVINNICWNIIFLHSMDEKILQQALKHMENVVKNGPEDCVELDTYANLLYKMGYCEEAIKCEEKLLTIAGKQKIYDKEWKDNLEKMHKGEPTWAEDF